MMRKHERQLKELNVQAGQVEVGQKDQTNQGSQGGRGRVGRESCKDRELAQVVGETTEECTVQKKKIQEWGGTVDVGWGEGLS